MVWVVEDAARLTAGPHYRPKRGWLRPFRAASKALDGFGLGGVRRRAQKGAFGVQPILRGRAFRTAPVKPVLICEIFQPLPW